MNQGELRLAVLIDADNISYRHIRSILEEIAKYGVPTMKRIYGDWTKPTVEGWKSLLLENAIIPVHQYSYTTGKNSTDSAMIIDAMDILYSGKVDGFCIVSSDSDFTRLAMRLREAGMKVYGVGEQKTPQPFKAACDKFTYVEVISGNESRSTDDQLDKSQKQKSKQINHKPIRRLEADMLVTISQTIEDIADEDGWAFLGDVGNLLIKKMPDFDPRNYGYQKLTPLVKNIKQFEVDERFTGNHGIKHNYIRNRKQS